MRGAPLKKFPQRKKNTESREKIFFPTITHGNFHSFIEPFQHAKRNFYELMKKKEKNIFLFFTKLQISPPGIDLINLITL